MAGYLVNNIEDKEDWESFVLSKNPKTFLQSWNWGETNKLLGKKIFRLGFFKGDKLVGVCLVIKELAKRGPYFVIPGGPLIEWSKKAIVSIFLKQIKNLSQKEGVWFVRIRPELIDNPENKIFIKRLGFISSPMHLHAENTWVLDIKKSDTELLKGMRKTTRYLVKKSLDMGLIFGQTSDPDSAKILARLQRETVERHKFVGFSEDLFRAQLLTFAKDGQAKLYFCRLGKRVLAAAMIIFYGKYAYYHHGASDKLALKIPASYFLQWKIIQEAKMRGCSYYNFWGIAPTDDPRHRFAGVTLFKKGFGGERIDWLHAHDLPLTPLYWITFAFEKIRKIYRRL